MTNNNDTKKEVFKITLNDIKNNSLNNKNKAFKITPTPPAANKDDIQQRPRFRKCKEIGCDKMYNCNVKIEVFFTNGGYTMDYFCKEKNKFVYYE